ncbi:hypothetical protein ABZ918_10460 [Streptomyces viridosporus]|uniref:hypothetical protein n=1 Tax=Streptomyces viridosporus TaxID=67581 RepID=UPI003442A6C9
MYETLREQSALSAAYTAKPVIATMLAQQRKDMATGAVGAAFGQALGQKVWQRDAFLKSVGFDVSPTVGATWAGTIARDALGTNSFGWKGVLQSITVPTGSSMALAAGFDRGAVLQGVIPSVASFRSDLFDWLRRPVAPGVPAQAEELAENLFPANLHGFSRTEWSQLIEICTADGIGLMWAPSAEHLRALIKASDRAARYAYLIQQQEAILEELRAGLAEVRHADLADLAALGQQAVACAEAGLWEGALALAANVLNTAMEIHGIAWYREEFKDVRDDKNQPITGFTGAGATVGFVIRNVPLPQPWVGIFEMKPHLVVRPLSETFLKATDSQDTFNRHLVAHQSSYVSFRREFLLPALLNTHALLRGLDEKMTQQED